MGKPTGLPKTGGRQKGTPNKTTTARDTALAESGLTSLSYLQSVYRDISLPDPQRMDAAKAALSFEHPRLSNVEHKGEGGGPIQVNVVRFANGHASE